MPRVPESFYEPEGDLYVATELTRGPWDAGAQHAGPPAALIGREVERLGGGRIDGSGNGVSAALDWRRYLFINVDLSVHLHRMPVGEWVCLDAETFPERNGIGMADTRLLDENGGIGRAAQTLLVAEREGMG
jgi:Acyl-CoA thioesterase C-terminal domain